jgi:predicted MFS family arabinose efflux permease
VTVTLFAAHESRDETIERKVDGIGIATLSAGLTALVLALVEGNRWGWGSPEILALLAVAGVGLVAFAVAERRVRAPMVDFAFFRSRTFLGANVVAFVVSFAMLAMFFFTALYMQNMLGYSAVEAGVRFLPATLVIIVAAPIAGRLVDRVGPRPLLVTGLSLVAVALFMQTRIDDSSGYGLLLPAFIVMGVGMGLTMTPMSTAAMNAVSVDKAGVASGILSMSRMVGGTFGVAALGALFQRLASDRLADTLAGAGIGAARREEIVHNIGSAKDTGAGLDPQRAAQVGRAARDAFIHALSGGMWLSTAMALAGALAALVLVRGGAAHRPEAAPSGEPAAEAVGV